MSVARAQRFRHLATVRLLHLAVQAPKAVNIPLHATLSGRVLERTLRWNVPIHVAFENPYRHA